MAERVAQLATFVNRPRRRRRNVTRNSAGKRELLEQLLHSGFVHGDVRVDVSPGALEVYVAYNRRTAVPRTSYVKHIKVILLDDSVQVHIDEVLARRRAPVSNH